MGTYCISRVSSLLVVTPSWSPCSSLTRVAAAWSGSPDALCIPFLIILGPPFLSLLLCLLSCVVLSLSFNLSLGWGGSSPAAFQRRVSVSAIRQGLPPARCPPSRGWNSRLDSAALGTGRASPHPGARGQAFLLPVLCRFSLTPFRVRSSFFFFLLSGIRKTCSRPGPVFLPLFSVLWSSLFRWWASCTHLLIFLPFHFPCLCLWGYIFLENSQPPNLCKLVSITFLTQVFSLIP